jgi:DNA helicase-2/ATP-dependent DNA helicase PcrA
MKDYSKYYDKLNARQKEAVDAIDGPSLVLAGPGTGKTQLLSVRSANIIRKKGIMPENILILTFTNIASREMKERLGRIMGPDGYSVEVDTFHGFANSVIQESEEATSYVKEKVQMSDIERVRAIEYALDNASGISELRPFGRPYYYENSIMARIGELKRDGKTPADYQKYLDEKSEWESHLEEKHIKRLRALSVIYKTYEELKDGKNADIFDQRGRYDYEDMILFATQALSREEGLRDSYRDRFKYVMVDEFQDTNGAQMKLLFALLGEGNPNLACVGDDDQSIFRFQGASSENFRLLEAKYPALKKIILKDNYRSDAKLIEAAGSIIRSIPKNERSADKVLEPAKKFKEASIEIAELSTEEEELLHIVRKIGEIKDAIASDKALSEEERSKPYNNIAILLRKRKQIPVIINALLKAGIPYATDGKEDSSGEKRVKQLVDVLELANISSENYSQKDMALYKILSADYFEIPQGDILRFLDRINSERDKDYGRRVSLTAEFLSYFGSDKDDIKFNSKQKLKRAYEAIRHLLEDPNSRPVHSLLMDFIKEAGIVKYVLREYRDMEVLRIRDLRAVTSFVNIIKEEDTASPGLRLEEFMQDMKTRKEHNLEIQGSMVTMTQDGVRVYTAHGSKGMEFHAVVIPFFLDRKSWPVKPPADYIPVPPDLFSGTERTNDKKAKRALQLYDETRLFYVALTRAKAKILLTASPSEDSVLSPFAGHLGASLSEALTSEEETLKSFLASTEATDPFIGTEEVLRDMIRNMALNPTRLNNYIDCRRKFLYNDVLKIPGSKKKSLVFGNCVHKALEETYKALQDTEKFPPFEFFKDAFTRELRHQGVDKAIERECLSRDQMNKLQDWFDSARKAPVVPISLEEKLTITVGDNIIFRGKYDKMEWQDKKAGAVRILDYKTGKPDDHVKKIAECMDVKSPGCEGYLRQLVAYKLLFEKDKAKSKGRKATHGVLVFIEPARDDMKKLGYSKGDHVTKVVEVTDAMTGRLEELIKEVWADIKALKFEKLKERDKEKCEFCDFKDICWG